MNQSKPILVLSGFMGAGKSTVGRRVAERAGVPFVDLDTVIADRAGRSVSEIFSSEGEVGFRRREGEELDRVASALGPVVVAVGGGALLDTQRRRAVLTRACVVTLVADPTTVLRRTAGRGRPLLDIAHDRLAIVGELLAARADAYAEAHAQVSTEGRSIEAVVDCVLDVWSRTTVLVPLGRRTYPVRFVSGDLEVVAAIVGPLEPSAVFVVTDSNVRALWGERLEEACKRGGLAIRDTVVLVPGEEHKQLAAVGAALERMVGANADRDAVVVGHGGGVVTDIAGFVASTLLRGVRWVAVPTTLLAMVDASVGGKTGVDVGLAKNAAGAFHQPSGTLVDVAQVSTETDRAFRSGLAEAVKSAAIGDAALFELLEAEAAAILGRDPALVAELVVRSVAVKAAMVGRDEHETGDRALLNFGHTVGHALEAEGGFSRLTHGEAVSLGMVAALRMGVTAGVTDCALEQRVGRLLGRFGLPTDLATVPLAAALRFVALDKKRRKGSMRFVFLHNMGEAGLHRIEPAEIPTLLGCG